MEELRILCGGTQKMIINRIWAMPNKWTFTIKPIKELLGRHIGDGRGWIDPFAGKHSPAQYTNDIIPTMPSLYHMDALDFCRFMRKNRLLLGDFKGILFDPPYSNRQISEHYKAVGRKVTALDTSQNFFARVKNIIPLLIPAGGLAISCGWNSAGIGKKRGFEIIEILLIPHGGNKNDTIVTVERKIR
jgi:hypothetical protein